MKLNIPASSSLIPRTFGKTVLVSTLLAAAAATGCTEDSQGSSGLQTELPTADQIAVKLPGRQLRAVGELAELWVDTREIANEINGAVPWALELVRTAIEEPARAVNGNVSSWGPWTAGNVEYQVEVTDLAGGGYEFRLLGRAAGTTGTFETLLSGKTLSGSRGELTVDFDADDRVFPAAHAQTGKVAINYDLEQRSLNVDVTARVGTSVSTVHHSYKGAADGGGELLFVVSHDAASASVRSRWQASGAGRADARVTADDTNTPEVTASECWDNQFLLTYSLTTVGGISDTDGDAASCVFADAALPPRS
ncbi:MAG: hypothetical protein R3B48_04205 [Kofleriaceae bacterium]